MKKVALIYGLISGAITVSIMLGTIQMMDRLSYRRAELVGYTGLILSALVIFFGVRSYRETAGQGRLTFGTGFKVGLLISIVASLCYVVSIQMANVAIPGLGEKFAVCMVRNAKESGAGAEEMQKIEEQLVVLRKIWASPALLAAVSFAESFPVGLGASLLSAGILRRKPGSEAPSA